MILPIIASIVVGCISGAVMFSVFFGSRDEFVECLRYYIAPADLSLLRGMWGETSWPGMKLFLWIIFAAAPGVAVYFWLSK